MLFTFYSVSPAYKSSSPAVGIEMILILVIKYSKCEDFIVKEDTNHFYADDCQLFVSFDPENTKVWIPSLLSLKNAWLISRS